MKNSIVIYYSNNGSNAYLANRISKELECPIEELKPMPRNYLILLTGLIFKNKKLKHDLSQYERIILVGPVWMGKFIAPLRLFVKKNIKIIKELVFVTCCGSTYDKKDEKFGHGLVFKKLKEELPDKCNHCEAFPITLVLPEDQWEQGEIVMKTRLNDQNFNGEILERFNILIRKMSA